MKKSHNHFGGSCVKNIYTFTGLEMPTKIKLLEENLYKEVLTLTNNKNWKKNELDDQLLKSLKYYTRENIFNSIPEIDNYYWMFINRSYTSTFQDDGYLSPYYSVSFGIYDIDNFKKDVDEYDKIDGSRKNNRYIQWLKEKINECWVGCYLNGRLINSPEERQLKKEEMADNYEQYKNDIFNEVLSSIAEQTGHPKR